MLYYATMTTIGSILGCLMLFWVGRKGEEALLRRKFAERQIALVSRWYSKYGVFAVMIPSILPPPTPFKVFVLFAGAFGISTGRFIVAITLGRGFRYFLEGYLAVRYGNDAIGYMHRNYPLIAGAIVLVLLLTGLALYLIHRNGKRTVPRQRET